MFVYTVTLLNKEHLGDARTQRFVHTVEHLNKEPLNWDATTQRFVYTVKSVNKEHLGDARTIYSSTEVCLIQ